uniref:Uncharacterized protein n=1 Tax=Panagrolaimus sp. ES5 TaxID=591445 RepID=A0AC34FPM9_9BILA
MFGINRNKNGKKSKLFIHKFGNLRNLISQKQWIEIQAIINQKTPLRTKHFDITKILTQQAKFNKSQVRIFWNDFFDFHEMKKVLMLHNKILLSFGQKSIENYGIYDVDLSVATKVKLLNAQIKRYLPKKDFEIYLRIQSKVFELSKGEKEALLI